MKWLVVFFVFSGIILSSFQYNANSVLVEQIESNFPIVIRYDSIKDYIFRIDRKSTRLNSSHNNQSRMPSSA